MMTLEALYKDYYEVSKAIEKERLKGDYGCFDEVRFEALIEDLDDIDEAIQRMTK